jgi:hypothetical protein
VFTERGISEHKYGKEFFDVTGINDKLFRDMRNAESDYCPSVQTLVAVCAGLDLDIAVAERLFAVSGRALRYSDEHIAYRMILTVCRGIDITERNDFLEVLGFCRLTDDR